MALGLDEAKGFLVTDITAGSPADKAGYEEGIRLTISMVWKLL